MSMTETPETEEQTIGQDGCCIPESEMLVVLDRNFEVPWKGGNKYSRICPECRSRTFCPESYWQARHDDPQGVAYVIERGEGGEDGASAVIRPLYVCPYTEAWAEPLPDDSEVEVCGEEFTGSPLGEEPPDECPHCERELAFGDEAEMEE